MTSPLSGHTQAAQDGRGKCEEGKGSGGGGEEEAMHASDRTADSRLGGSARAELLPFVAEL